MKRDAIPTPGPAALPERIGMRNTRAMVNTARQALRQRDYRVAELGEHIEAMHPGRTVFIDRLVDYLVALHEAELVDDKLGLTDEGERVAAMNGARVIEPRRHCRAAPPSGEDDRRIALLAGTNNHAFSALTRGQPRAAASAADLAPPPIRPGAEACLELPSRIGQELHYRDGRITRMDGTEIQAAHTPTTYRPTRDGRNPDQRMGWRESQATW